MAAAGRIAESVVKCLGLWFRRSHSDNPGLWFRVWVVVAIPGVTDWEQVFRRFRVA